jgi:hypothetical protein
MQFVPAPVVRILAPLDQPTRLEFVHQPNQSARLHAQRAGERLLRNGWLRPQNSKNPGMRRR